MKVTDTPQLRMGFQSSSTRYLDSLLSNIEGIFEDSSMEKLTLADKILYPAHLPSSLSEKPVYGQEELNRIIQWFGPVENHPGLVDAATMKKDYLQFELTIRKLTGKSLRSVCETLIKKYNDSYPDFCVLAKYMLTAPLTSVPCERGFSSQNRIKTKSRAKIDNDRVTKLIRVMEEGPEIEDFNVDQVAVRFDDLKKKRK